MTSAEVDMTSPHNNVTSGDNASEAWTMDEMEWQMMAELEKSFRDSRYTYRDPLTAALIGVYVVVFLLSIVGNVLVIVIIRLDKSNRGIDAYLMLNLAVADLLVAIACIPLTAAQLVYAAWLYGQFLCKASSYLQGVSVGASVMTIMLLSVDRYVAVRHPVKSRNFSSAGIVIATTLCATWLVAGAVMAPLAAMRSVDRIRLPSGDQLDFCHEAWPSRRARQAFDVALCVFIYVVPGLVVAASYIATGRTLLSGGRDVALLRRDGDITGAFERALAGRRRAAVMLLLVAGLFASFWLPYHVINLYLAFAPPSSTVTSSDGGGGGGAGWIPWLASLSLLLGHSHSAQNPFVYFVMSRAFKRDLIALLTCRRLTSRAPHTQSSLYGDWCRKHSVRSQRSQRSDSVLDHHHRHNDCRPLTGHVTRQLPLSTGDVARRRDDVIELAVSP